MRHPLHQQAAGTGSPSPAAQPAVLRQLKRRKKYRLRRMNYHGISPLLDEGAEGGDGQAVAELQDQITRLRAEAQEASERALRARAELENQRRRHQKEKEELRKFASEDLIRTLIPAMDHFGLALHSLETASDPSSIAQGVTMIHREIMGVLQQAGLEEIPAIDQPFDPTKHEAAATECIADKPNNVVVEVMRPGWALRERVIRPALVKVNKVEESSA